MTCCFQQPRTLPAARGSGQIRGLDGRNGTTNGGAISVLSDQPGKGVWCHVQHAVDVDQLLGNTFDSRGATSRSGGLK
jgi:hypothetical protein